MSGPKCYSPPPRYSLQVFDGKLNQVFQLQSRLKMLCSEIEGLHVSDSALKIHFDCNRELGSLKKGIDDALKMLVFDYKGTFGQEVYDRVNSEIGLKSSALQKQLDSCNSIKAQFSHKQTDYESYRHYLLFHNNSRVSFDDFKKQILCYLKNNLESRLPDVFNEANTRIDTIKFQKEASTFTFGFNRKLEAEKLEIIQYVAQKENEINGIRAEISNKVLDTLHKTGMGHGLNKQGPAVPEGTEAVIEKIRTLINQCDEPASRKVYSDYLRQLTESESLKDLYFFKELHDSILDAEKTKRTRIEVHGLLAELNETKLHKTTEVERQNLVTRCLNLLASGSSRNKEVEALRLRLKQLVHHSNTCVEEDLIKEREHIFLKSQIVLCLENRGYEVMDDLEVIDFEQQSDLLLKVPDQENYLNLKFKADGSMRYVFQIPENREDLNTDQKNLKFHEMKVTCDEFRAVLQDLSTMGLNVNLRSDKPIEFDSLVSVPKSKRDLLKAKSRSREKHQLRKKYLTAGAS